MAFRRFVRTEEMTKKLASMVVNKKAGITKSMALAEQEKFADAWAEDINEMIGFSEQPVAQRQLVIDLAQAKEMIAKGESIVTLGPARPELYQGDIVTNIYTVDMIGLGQLAEYPIERIGDSEDFAAFSIPDDGRIPERLSISDSVTIRPFTIANAAYWKADYAALGNSMSIQKARNRFDTGFVKKINDIGWYAILAAGNAHTTTYVATDGNTASSGILSPKVINAMTVTMRRFSNGGTGNADNAASPVKYTLTDVFCSPEAFASYLDGIGYVSSGVAGWPSPNLGGQMVQQLLEAGFNTSIRVHNVNIHVMDELGFGKEYDTYLKTTLGLALSTGKKEFVIGLDLSKRDNFVMPVGQNIVITPDDGAILRQRMGFTGTCNLNAAVLDAYSVVVGCI